MRVLQTNEAYSTSVTVILDNGYYFKLERIALDKLELFQMSKTYLNAM